MPIITAADLRAFSARNVSYPEQRTFSSRQGQLLEHRAQRRTTVFLSHSHTDHAYVADAVALLSKIGVDVYVDWQDASMPAVTSGITATKLKDRIRLSSKFVLLASPQAICSNWVNWELGYGDSVKYIEHMALLPVLPDSTTAGWPNAEYLQIYPYIEQDTSYSAYYGQLQTTYYVTFPDKRRVELSKWLHSN